MKVVILSVLFLVGCAALKDETGGHADFLLKWSYGMNKIYNSKTLLHQLKEMQRSPDTLEELPEVEFNCQVETSPTPPTTAHEVRPSDINVIGATGDSISAGNGLGAETLPEVAIQNRGEVFSVGGNNSLEENVTTIANILKKFNPNLKGYSTGTGWPADENSWMNQAIPGARATHLLFQSRALLDRMKQDSRIDYANDWKLITFFIGGNDLCRYCYEPDDESPEIYRQHIQDALDELHVTDPMPRTIVNVVVMFDVTPLSNLSKNAVCDVLQTAVCGCAVNPDTQGELRGVQLGYWQELDTLISSGRYDTRSDFTVILQPHMRDLVPFTDPITGDWDKTILSPDCFHPSRKMHQFMAIMLWDTMLTPVGQKRYAYAPEDLPTHFKCPTTTNPYIFTNLNSNRKVEKAVPVSNVRRIPVKKSKKLP